MIYGLIDDRAKDVLNPVRAELMLVKAAIEEKQEAVKTEDSKRREAEMREEIKDLRKRQHELWGKESKAQEAAFKELLVEAYGLPFSHPKFNKIYNYAYQQSHSSGFSEIEITFSELVDIVKD